MRHNKIFTRIIAFLISFILCFEPMISYASEIDNVDITEETSNVEVVPEEPTNDPPAVDEPSVVQDQEDVVLDEGNTNNDLDEEAKTNEDGIPKDEPKVEEAKSSNDTNDDEINPSKEEKEEKTIGEESKDDEPLDEDTKDDVDKDADECEHTFVYTSNNDGTHTITCEKCDHSQVEDCSFVDGVCEKCGYKEEIKEQEEFSHQDLEKTINGYRVVASGEMPKNAELKVSYIENDDSIEKIVDDSLGNKTSFTAIATFDIDIYVDGAKWQPENDGKEISVSIDYVDCAKDNESNLKVYRVEDEKVTDMDADVVTDKMVSFETEHFTPYTVGLTATSTTWTETYHGLTCKFDGNGTLTITGSQNSNILLNGKTDSSSSTDWTNGGLYAPWHNSEVKKVVANFTSSKDYKKCGMFYDCPAEEFETGASFSMTGSDYAYMFYNAKFKKITIAKGSMTINGSNNKLIFMGCTNLEYLNMSACYINTGYDYGLRLEDCTKLNTFVTPRVGTEPGGDDRKQTLPCTMYKLNSDGSINTSKAYTEFERFTDSSFTLVRPKNLINVKNDEGNIVATLNLNDGDELVVPTSLIKADFNAHFEDANGNIITIANGTDDIYIKYVAIDYSTKTWVTITKKYETFASNVITQKEEVLERTLEDRGDTLDVTTLNTYSNNVFDKVIIGGVESSDSTITYIGDEMNITIVYKYDTSNLFKVETSITYNSNSPSKLTKYYNKNSSFTFNTNNYKKDNYMISSCTLNDEEVTKGTDYVINSDAIINIVYKTSAAGTYTFAGLTCVVDDEGVCTITGTQTTAIASGSSSATQYAKAPWNKLNGISKIVCSFTVPSTITNYGFFSQCKATEIVSTDELNWKGGGAGPFSSCPNLEKVDLSHGTITFTKDSLVMFLSDTKLKYVDLSNVKINTSKYTLALNSSTNLEYLVVPAKYAESDSSSSYNNLPYTMYKVNSDGTYVSIGNTFDDIYGKVTKPYALTKTYCTLTVNDEKGEYLQKRYARPNANLLTEDFLYEYNKDGYILTLVDEDGHMVESISRDTTAKLKYTNENGGFGVFATITNHTANGESTSQTNAGAVPNDTTISFSDYYAQAEAGNLKLIVSIDGNVVKGDSYKVESDIRLDLDFYEKVTLTVKDEDGTTIKTIEGYPFDEIDTTSLAKEGYTFKITKNDAEISEFPIQNDECLIKYEGNEISLTIVDDDGKTIKVIKSKAGENIDLSSLDKEGYATKIVDDKGNKITITPIKDGTYTLKYEPTTQELTIKDEEGNIVTTISGKTGEDIDLTSLAKNGFIAKLFDENNNEVIKVPTKNCILIVKYDKEPNKLIVKDTNGSIVYTFYWENNDDIDLEAIYSSIAKEGYYHDLYYEDGTYLWGGNANNIKDGDVVIVQYTPNQNKIYVCLEDGTLKGWFNGYTDEDISKYSSNFKKTDCTVKFFDEEGNEVSKVPPKECTLIVKYFRNFKVSINIYDTEESKPIKSYTLNGYEGTSVTFNKNNYKIDGKRIWKTTINGKEFFEDELTFSEDASIFLNVCSDTIEGVYKWCGLDCVIDENGVCTISGSLMETPSSQYGANNYMYNAPYAKYGVKKIVGSFDNPNSVDTTSLFRGLKDVREIELNNVVFCGKLDYTFALCDYLTTITIQNIEFRNIESCDYMFYSDKYLKTINISNSSGEFLLGKFSGIFSGDIRLEKINLGENAVIPNSFTGNNAFGSCVNLKEINSILDNGNTTTNITLPGEFKKYTYDSANDTYTYQGTTNVLEKGFVLKREDGKTEATINAYDYDTKEFLCSFEALPGDYFSSFKKNLPDEYIADKWTNMDGFRAINNLKYYIEDSSSEDGLKSVDKIPANIYGQTLKIYVKKRPYVDINLYNGDNNKHIVSTYNVVAGDNYFNTVKSYANKVYSDGATWITVDKDGNEWDYIIPNQTSTYYVKYTHPVVKITVKDEEGNILGSIDSYEKKGIDRTPFIKKGYYLNYYDEDGNYISTTPLTDITVIAKYTANTYYFNLYGVDNKFVKGLSTKSDDILKLSSLEKEGYYFKIFERDDRANPNETKVEYDIQVDENNEKYIIAPPSDEFNFCATIEYYPTTQELTIKDMDGNLITTISGETNTTIDRTFYNCPDGYTFSIVDSEGNIVTKVPTKDTTLFIKLTPKTFRYTIRYKYWLSTEYNDYIIVTAKVGEKITMSENSWLARNFYLSFVDENGNAITTYPSEACDIYVIQTPKTFTAKIVDDNDNEIVTITKEYLSKVYISDIPEICRDGYVPNIVNDNAGGWILEFDENGEPFFYMTEDNGIYEIERYFLVNNHVIVKDENGNSIFEFDLKLSDWLFSDEPYIVPCPPTIDGCNFIGYKLSDGSVVSPSRLLELSNKWRETGDLSDEEANEAQYIYDGLYEYLYLPEASTIVAVYDRLPFYTVKFENENGDVIKTIEKELNQEVTLIDGPIKAHYSFEGWKVKGTNDILEETTIKKDSPCEVTLVPVYKRLRVVNVYDGTSNKRDTLLYSFDWDGETTIQLKDTVPDELKNDKIRYFGFTDFYGDTDYRKETLYKTNSSSYEFSIWIKSFMYLNRLYFYDKVTGATLFNGYFEVDKDIKDYFIEKEKDFKPHDIKDDFYKVEDESGNEWDYKVPWFKDGDFKVLKYYITYNHPTINITIKINNTNEVVTVLKGIAGTAVDITLLQRQGYKLVHSIPSTFPYEDITTSVQYIPIEQQYTIHRMNSKGIEEYSFKTRKFTNSVISLNGWGKIGYSMRIVDKDDNEISTYPGDCLDIYLKYTPIVQTIDIIDSTGKVLTTIDGTIEDYISINQIDEIKKDGYYCWIDDLSFDYKSFDGTYQSMRFKFPGDGRDINVIYLPIKYNVVVKDENKNSLDTFEVSYTSMYQNEYVLPAPKQINGCNFLGYKDSNGNTLSIDEVERLSKLREDSLTDEEYEFMNQYNNLMMNSFKQENSNVTFIAVYDRLPFYTVKFENEKDDVIKTIETNLAESTNLIDAPTKDGYDFKGWIVKGDEEKKILDKTISSDKVCEITLVPTYAIKQKAPENNKPSEGNNSNTNNNTPSSTTPSSSTPPTSTSTPTIDKKVEPTKDIQKEEVKEEPTRKVDDITKDNKEEVVKPTTNNENIKEETTTPSNENNNTKVEGKETSSVPTVEIHGVIENKEGEYIVDANVVIAKQSTKEIVVKTTTNKKGQYSASLPSGEFEIEITSKEGEIILSREISIPKNVAENEEDFDISVITLSDEQIAKAGFHTLEMEEIEETSNNMQQIIIIILIFIFVILLLVTSFAIKKSLKNKKH